MPTPRPVTGCVTRTSVLWLTATDLQAFSDALGASLPGLSWMCTHVGPVRGQSRPHPTLMAALQCGYGDGPSPHLQQAAAQLPLASPDAMHRSTDPDGNLSAAADAAAHQAPQRASAALGLLLLNAAVGHPARVVPARDYGPGADLAAWPRDFIEVPASGLGITWDRADGDARSGAAMEAQVQGVWRALHRVTERVTVRNAMPGAPQDAQTLPARCRMGPHMASLMHEHGWCLRYGSVYRLV